PDGPYASHSPPPRAALTSARTAALIAAGRSGQADTTSARSGGGASDSAFGSAPVSQDSGGDVSPPGVTMPWKWRRGMRLNPWKMRGLVVVWRLLSRVPPEGLEPSTR